MTRYVQVSDSPNFRHLGGYETEGGRKTRGDLLYRGGWFNLNGDRDRERFEATGIARIFDFRSEPERARKPLSDEIRARADVVELGISPGSMGPYLRRIADMPPEEVDCKGAMTRMHFEMLNEGLPRFRAFFEGLAVTEDPFLIMCSTGKDRTGVASALLLTALGVPREKVLEDYLISADVYRGKELLFARNHGMDALGIDLNLVTDVFTVHPEYLGAVLARAEQMSGSLDDFLGEHMGLDDAARDTLRDRFTA